MHSSEKNKAILYMIISTFAFSLMNFAIKAADTPLFMKLLFRNSVGMFVALYMVKKNKVKLFGSKGNRHLLFFRCLFGFMGMITVFYSVTKLNLSDGATLTSLPPFFVLILSGFLLKEKVRFSQFIAICLALTGVVVITNPSYNSDIFPALIGVLSSLLAGLAYIYVKKCSGKEDPSTIIFCFSAFSTLGSAIPAIITWQTPTIKDLLFLILTGLCAAAGQYFMTYSYKFAPASTVSIYMYLKIIFSMIISIVLFSQYPTLTSIVGAGFIILGGYTNYRTVNKQLAD